MAHACYSQNITITTAYDNLGEDALAYSLNECSISTLFTHFDLVEVIKRLGDKVSTLKNVIFSGNPNTDFLKPLKATYKSINFFTVDEVKALGQSKPVADNPPTPQDICCIMYTSGSTGTPKGVLITHSNLVAAMAGCHAVVKESLKTGEEYLAYLPLAHILEYTIEHVCIFSGLPLGYGSPRTLTDILVRNCKGDIGELKPVFMAGVPAVWETIRKGILSKLENASPIQRLIFNRCVAWKSYLVSKGYEGSFLNFAFKKIRDGTGGRLKLAVTGGAPIAPQTQEFLSVTLCNIVQGYGMTESCGTISIQRTDSRGVYSSVGSPFPCCEVKLVAYNQYNPNPTDGSAPQGEVWARGQNIMKGYFNRPDLTAETISSDGWLMTGDIGEWRPDGSLSIIDRKKNLIKLSHGEYVAIEKLESEYRTSQYVLNMMIYADPLESHVVAIIIPKEEACKKLAESLKVDLADYNNSEFLKKVSEDFIRIAKDAKFKGAENLNSFKFVNDEWTADNDMLTAAQKLNRNAIVKKYKEDIKKLYKD